VGDPLMGGVFVDLVSVVDVNLDGDGDGDVDLDGEL
jgi:hypothetical protein